MSDSPPSEPTQPSGASPMDPLDRPERPTTPPRSAVPLTEDTPPKRHASQSYRSGTLNEKRAALISDLGHTIPEVELEYFLENTLPALHDDFQLQEIVDSLKANGHIVQDRWKLFETDPKKDTNQKEDKVFDSLTGVFNSIVDAANKESQVHEQTLMLSLNPDKAPNSKRKSRNRPDGCMILKEKEETIVDDKKANRSWYDFALTFEVKKSDYTAERNDNISKQIFNMQYLMSIDPCRRFVFGITIENTDMRLWFSCRATMLVSKPFNFIKDYTMLTHVFLSLAFASKSELGWDPTITVSETKEGRVYHFDVEGRKFDSVGVLSDFAADAIIGRATRAFRVIDPASKVEYVLKDVWFDDDRELEHEIYLELLGDIEKVYGKDVREEAEKLLLTPVVSCKVKVDGQDDHTCKVMMCGKEPSLKEPFSLCVTTPVSTTTQRGSGFLDIHDHLGTRAPREDARKRIQHRIHYRVVFEEVATPLYNVMDLRGIFVVLKDCTRLLELMHGCGWVHRDISCGNVYFYKGRGRLGDLEYAKKKGTGGKHDVRTGTLDFMSVEVARSKYLFRSERSLEVLESKLFSGAEPIIPRQTFRYNDIHDMESLWWLPIWMMFFHDIKSQVITDESHKKIRKLAIDELFPRNLGTGPRMEFLANEAPFLETMLCLRGSFGIFFNALNFLRSHLKRSYQLYESTLPTPNDTVLDGLHVKVFKTWDVCIESVTGDTTLVPVKSYDDDVPVVIPSSSKRKATAVFHPSAVPAMKVPRIGSPDA